MAVVRSSTQSMGVLIAGVLAERMTEVRRLEGQPLVNHGTAQAKYLGSVVKEATELVQLIDVDGLVGITRDTAYELLPTHRVEARERCDDLAASARLAEGKGFAQD
jgi:hypothetical protein